MRLLPLFLAASCIALNANAANYKCKDASGNWSEAACTGAAKPPAKAEKIDWNHWEPQIGMTIDTFDGLKMAYDTDRKKANPSGGFRISDDEPFNEWLGGPEKKNKTHTAQHDREQWVFHMGYLTRYLYFVDGVLTTIQD